MTCSESVFSYFRTLISLVVSSNSQVIAAFDPSLIEHNGSYLDDGVVHNELAPTWSRSDEGADKLWELSEKAWNIKF